MSPGIAGFLVADGRARWAEASTSSGVELVDARPSDALNLIALVPAPILVAPEVLADAQARMEGDSPEAILMRRALAARQMTIQRQASDP